MRSIHWRTRAPSAWRAPDTIVTSTHHHAIDPQNTPSTVVMAMVVENGPRGASVANSAANMMTVCGLVSVSRKALA